jgi:hypothetical protein
LITDERIFAYKVGKPIPEWDLRHRLPIDKSVGPDSKDTATIFRINSTYMDVADQPYRYRQLLVGGVLTSCVGAAAFFVFAVLMVLNPKASDAEGGLFSLYSIVLSGFIGFAYIAVRTAATNSLP